MGIKDIHEGMKVRIMVSSPNYTLGSRSAGRSVTDATVTEVDETTGLFVCRLDRYGGLKYAFTPKQIGICVFLNEEQEMDAWEGTDPRLWD